MCPLKQTHWSTFYTACYLQVRDTGSARGRGVFAVANIPNGSYIGDYEGDILDLLSFYTRYPTGVVWLSECLWLIAVLHECLSTQLSKNLGMWTNCLMLFSTFSCLKSCGALSRATPSNSSTTVVSRYTEPLLYRTSGYTERFYLETEPLLYRTSGCTERFYRALMGVV